jgi:nitrous oxidase accessory protein NosD
VFVFSPGVYTGVSIQPKSGQRFLGEPGAVLDGNGTAFAFRSGAGDVVISGLEITDYRPASRDGVVQGGTGWLVQGNHIHHNGEIGVHDLVGGRVIGNNIHHNGRYGIAGGGFVLVEGNEIAYNANEIGLTGDSGGTKFVFTTDLVVRDNYVHGNCGHGLWADIDNVNVLTENNRVVANRGNGIFYEIGCGPGGVIRNNHVEGNGFPERYASWMGDTAGIVVALTSGVEVYGNTLVNNTKGIGGIQWDHPGVGLVKRCTPQLSNLNVHGNVITQSGGAAAGIDANTHQDKVWSSWGNRFHSNTYHLSNGARFRWQGNWLTQEQWKAADGG